MTVKETILKIMEKENIGFAQLGNRINVSSAAMWDRLKGKNKFLKTNIVVQMLNAMDYKIVIMPRELKTPKDSYEVSE